MAWLLYFISLIPLFIYVAIKYYDCMILTRLIEWDFSCITYGQYAFIISILSFALSIILILFLKHKSRAKFDLHGAKIIGEPQNINHELIGVLSAVVLPFITVNFDSANESIASLFMLLVIGIITTRSSIYYKNPVLALLYLKIYQVNVEHKVFENPTTVNIISFHQINQNDSLYLKEIGEKVYYGRKTSINKGKTN